MSSSGNNEFERLHGRRSSFSPGSSLSEFFSSSRQPQTASAYPGPITSAAAHANTQRRLSLSGTSPPQIQTGFSLRRGSVSSISSATSATDESAIDDTEAAPGGSPTTPFARRMSWGARALRDVRIPSASKVPPSPGASSPTVSRGFWPDTKGYANDPALQQRRMSMPAPPVNSLPTPKETSVDPLQERMLRNEFYMD